MCLNKQHNAVIFLARTASYKSLQTTVAVIHDSQMDCKKIVYLIKRAINGPACAITLSAFDEVEHRSNRSNIYRSLLLISLALVGNVESLWLK